MMLYDGSISSKASESELYSQSLYLEYRKIEASLVQEFEHKVNDANAKKNLGNRVKFFLQVWILNL